MTLITVASNLEFVVQVADRRVTWSDGRVASDDETKTFHFLLPAADFLIGYTGIARIHDEPMQRVLMSELMKAAKEADYGWYETFGVFRDRLDRILADPWVQRFPPSQRLLSVIATGFTYEHHLHIPKEVRPYSPAQVLITNFESPQSDGRLEAANDLWIGTWIMGAKLGPAGWWPTVNWFGAKQALQEDVARSELLPLIQGGKPATAVRDKIVSLVPAQVRKHKGISPNVNAAILWPNREVKWTYHGDENLWTQYRGGTLIATPGNTIAISHVTISNADPSPPVGPFLPNASCPCGSGRRYRQCHGPLRTKWRK